MLLLTQTYSTCNIYFSIHLPIFISRMYWSTISILLKNMFYILYSRFFFLKIYISNGRKKILRGKMTFSSGNGYIKARKQYLCLAVQKRKEMKMIQILDSITAFRKRNMKLSLQRVSKDLLFAFINLFSDYEQRNNQISLHCIWKINKVPEIEPHFFILMHKLMV